ncbi:hypothetical protein D3C76_1441090 [compost metagenome]
MALNLGHDFLGDRPFVQGIGTFMGNAFEHRGQGRILQQGASGFRAAIGVEKVGHHLR